MPTRFPAGLNLYPGDSSLKNLPTPWPNLQGWSVWHDDFEKYCGWTLLADSTGTAGAGSTFTSASMVSTMGLLESVTAAADNDKNTLFPTPRVADALVPIVPCNTIATTLEWMFATRVRMETSLASGFAMGAATAGTIDASGTAGNMTTAAPTNGLYIRKAVTTAGDLEFCHSRGATMSTITLVAAASLVIDTWYKVVVHIKNGVVRAWVNDVQAPTTITAVNMTTSIAPFIQTINGDTGGAEVAQMVQVDYLLFAWKHATATSVR